MTCTGNKHLPICCPQFTFSLMDESSLGKELINSAREFIRLLSYLTIDMGWSSNDITRFNETYGTNDIYADKYLIDTFHKGMCFKVNYNGYCKYSSNKYATKRKCYLNENNGMDIMTILMRDIGIQLGELSSLSQNDTLKLGNSVVYTYKLATRSLFHFIRKDYKEDNMFAKIVLGVNSQVDEKDEEQKNLTNFEKIIIVARLFTLFNQGIRWILVVEMIMACICFLASIFSLLLLLQPISYKATVFSFLMALSYLLLATTTFVNAIILQIILRTLAPALDANENILPSEDDWGLIKVHTGSGFILGCLRFGFQCIFFIATTLVLYLHKRKPEEQNQSDCGHESKLFDEELPPINSRYSPQAQLMNNHWCDHI